MLFSPTKLPALSPLNAEFPNEVLLYEQRFKEALATLKALGESKDVRDEARYDNVRMAPQ